MIKVHQFRVWDHGRGDFVVQPQKATAARVAVIGGEIIAGTDETVEPSSLDHEERYQPPTGGSENPADSGQAVANG